MDGALGELSETLHSKNILATLAFPNSSAEHHYPIQYQKLVNTYLSFTQQDPNTVETRT